MTTSTPATKPAADPALAALGAALMYKRPVEALPEGGFRITVDVKDADKLAEVLLLLRGL